MTILTNVYGSQRCCRPCVFCTERITIITHRDMSKLSSTCIVNPPLNRKYYDSGKDSIQHTGQRTDIPAVYKQHSPWSLAKHAVPIHCTHIFKWHSYKDAVVTTYTSCLDNTKSYFCTQCIYVFRKTLPINSDWCSNQLHNAMFTAQWELNCNNILTNLKGSKLMPLTAEARVRSQASLRDDLWC
jgi:hypothetical protein